LSAKVDFYFFFIFFSSSCRATENGDKIWREKKNKQIQINQETANRDDN
jgi:hypothetical protein